MTRLTSSSESSREVALPATWVLFIFLIGIQIILLMSCSSDKPNEPNYPVSDRLAGGGRESNDDPFVGGTTGTGPNDSLPVLPGFDSTILYFPVFMSQQSCPETEQHEIVSSEAAWNAWWENAVECANGLKKSLFIPIPGDSSNPDTTGAPPDTGIVVPDSLWPLTPPYVNFGTSVIVVVHLEEGISGRYIWITQLDQNEGELVVHYEVMSPGEDCFSILVDPYMMATPVAAFVIPRPMTTEYSWQRTNSTYQCTWEPDPADPLTLYYTDAPCSDLGPDESIIRNAADLKSWLESAWQCDQERWGNKGDSLILYPDSSIGDEPSVPPIGIETIVNFETHAVIVLRAFPQSRWGGGIWLNRFEVGSGGTTIDYSVMVPGDQCPEAGTGETLRPTVAIRVPLPLTEPINWVRHVETISCDWPMVDTTRIIPE